MIKTKDGKEWDKYRTQIRKCIFWCATPRFLSSAHSWLLPAAWTKTTHWCSLLLFYRDIERQCHDGLNFAQRHALWTPLVPGSPDCYKKATPWCSLMFVITVAPLSVENDIEQLLELIKSYEKQCGRQQTNVGRKTISWLFLLRNATHCINSARSRLLLIAWKKKGQPKEMLAT